MRGCRVHNKHCSILNLAKSKSFCRYSRPERISVERLDHTELPLILGPEKRHSITVQSHMSAGKHAQTLCKQ